MHNKHRRLKLSSALMRASLTPYTETVRSSDQLRCRHIQKGKYAMIGFKFWPYDKKHIPAGGLLLQETPISPHGMVSQC